MKRFAVPYLKKTIVLVLAALLAFTFISCEYFEIPIDVIVKEKLENAVVERVDVSRAALKNNDGIDCIPYAIGNSKDYYSAEGVFSGEVRNPRRYNLKMRYDLSDGTLLEDEFYDSWNDYTASEILARTQHRDVCYVLDNTSKTFVVYFSKDFLISRELSHDYANRDLSGTITLYDADSGREFEPYPVTLRANTPPESPSDLTLQRNSNGTQYILCFKMPSSLLNDPVTFDTHILEINGTKRYFHSYENFDDYFYTDSAMTIVAPDCTTVRPEGLRPLKDDGDLYSEDDETVSIYYYTNVDVTTEEKVWRLFFEDDEGLQSITEVVSNNEKTLTSPWLEEKSDSIYSVDESGTYKLKVYHDGMCLDDTEANGVLIAYTLYDENGDEISSDQLPITSASGGNYVEIPLAKGKFGKIKVWAKGRGFTSSDPVSLTNITIKQLPEFYVSKIGSDSAAGTKGSPLRTIQCAVLRLGDEYPDEESYNIYLLSDITEEAAAEGNFITIVGDGKTYNIVGYNSNFTIDASRDSGVKGSVIYADDGAKLTLRNITIRGGCAEKGGGLYVASGANVTLKDCIVSHNSADDAAGIYNEGTLVVQDCTINANAATNDAGGIGNYGTATVTDSKISENSAAHDAGGVGNRGTFTLTNCEISSNIANNEDGGVGNVEGLLTLTNCTVKENRAVRGGGILQGDTGYIEINGGIIEKNIATGGNGGAIYIYYKDRDIITLDGEISIPAGNGDALNDIYFNDYSNDSGDEEATITIGNDFDYKGSSAWIDFPEYVHGIQVFSGDVAKAYGHFNPIDTNYSITNLGKLLVSPHIYVSSISSSPAGDDESGLGSIEKPYATVTRALDKINEYNLDGDYVIHVNGTIRENIVIYSELFETDPASITICGTNMTKDIIEGIPSSDPENSAIVIANTFTNPVILKNLTIKLASEGQYDGIMNSGKLTLENCNIPCTVIDPDGEPTQNGCVYVEDSDESTLSIKGKITMGVCLSGEQVVNISGALDGGSRIGVLAAEEPEAPTSSSPAKLVTITKGFGQYSGLSSADISTVFSSLISVGELDYVVIPNDAGEAALAVSGGSYSGGDISSGNLNFEFTDAASNGNAVTSFYAGYAKDIYVTANIPGENDPISPSNLTYTFKLKTGNTTVATLVGTTTGNSVKITLPSTLRPDDYRLYVTATYNGVTYDCSYPLEGIERLVATTPAPSGFVGVLGATITGAVRASLVFVTNRTVEIPDLYVCDHEVTQGEYQAVMGSNPSNFDGSSGKEAASGETQSNRPVEKVSWYEAIVYCNTKSMSDNLTPCYTINNSTNPTVWGTIPTSSNETWDDVTCNFNANGYRLPTEAEWEYIARGGNNGIPATQYTYSGSGTIDNVAWYQNNSESKTHEVKKKTANSLGIYDMSGNVGEWCWDWYATVSVSASTPATGESSGSDRVKRGGSWNLNSAYNRIIDRSSNSPDFTYYDLGFRVVRTIQ